MCSVATPRDAACRTTRLRDEDKVERRAREESQKLCVEEQPQKTEAKKCRRATSVAEH